MISPRSQLVIHYPSVLISAFELWVSNLKGERIGSCEGLICTLLIALGRFANNGVQLVLRHLIKLGRGRLLLPLPMGARDNFRSYS